MTYYLFKLILKLFLGEPLADCLLYSKRLKSDDIKECKATGSCLAHCNTKIHVALTSNVTFAADLC